MGEHSLDPGLVLRVGVGEPWCYSPKDPGEGFQEGLPQGPPAPPEDSDTRGAGQAPGPALRHLPGAWFARRLCKCQRGRGRGRAPLCWFCGTMLSVTAGRDLRVEKLGDD